MDHVFGMTHPAGTIISPIIMSKQLFVVSLLLTTLSVQSDWINEMRLTLANYALRKAINPPPGFLCTVIGITTYKYHTYTAHTN